MPIYALTLQGVFNSLEPHAHGEAQVDDFWQKMVSRQCLQSQVTGTPWNCFLRRASTKACYCATSSHYAHLCSDVARSVQQSGATCSWWSTGGWFLTKNDITTVSSVAGNWHTLKLLLASCVNKRLLLCHILPLCASMLWRCKECSTVWSHMLMVKHRWMISDKKWYHDSVFSRR